MNIGGSLGIGRAIQPPEAAWESVEQYNRRRQPGNRSSNTTAVMKEVTKDQFKKIYFKFGGGDATGWSSERWYSDFEYDEKPAMKYMAQEPETPEHTRMMIVVDYGRNEYRLFFMTEEAEDRFFDFPGKS
jgi:hypothetical protein